jgi:hypothetical protein
MNLEVGPPIVVQTGLIDEVDSKIRSSSVRCVYFVLLPPQPRKEGKDCLF